jgi:transcriptional regulator with XRE-family HTH domain
MDLGRAPHKSFDFKTWRQSLGWTQAEAAEQLALSRRGYQIYETAYSGLFPRRVPKPVIRLAELLAERSL